MMRALLIAALLPVAAPAAAQTAAPVATPSTATPSGAADRVAAALIPPGIYGRIMQDMFPKMVDTIMAQSMKMTGAELGVDPSDTETVAEKARKADPAFEERTKIMTRVMGEEMAVLFGEMEPVIRSALGRELAKRYSPEQLTDLDRFFATPTGRTFAGDYLVLFTSPEMMSEMTTLSPKMMQAMPAIMKKVEAATAHLPAPSKPAEKSE
ncbi:DUF2059 domain-containing protein [Sphingomonas sp. FW199]|uniref:DUF2059 domain-containing protein n=1 Tax=Sphingomonas sp. FW199 TaxID=3400217 RepID=UPI003CE7F55D